MPDVHLLEEEAGRYVLGELTEVERHEFETQLAQSAELRALVRELEGGVVALSLAAPKRNPPEALWTRIEAAVGETVNPGGLTHIFWAEWWRYGWAAAAACLVGWVLYALLINRPSTTAPSLPAVADLKPAGGTTSPAPPLAKGGAAIPQNRVERPLPQSKPEEITALRWQVWELTNRITRLSEAILQQQAVLSEPDRLKFFQLASVSPGMTSLPAASVSPNLQRALFLGMARELGWLPSTPAADPTGSADKQEWQGTSTSSAVTNHAGVDFIDLRLPSHRSDPSVQPPPETEVTVPPEPPTFASLSNNGVPGFLSGTNAILAFDASVVPAGGSLTFWRTTSSGQYEVIGTATLGNNAMVVTVPFASTAGAGGKITVVAGTAGGASNLFQFAAPGMFAPP